MELLFPRLFVVFNISNFFVFFVCGGVLASSLSSPGYVIRFSRVKRTYRAEHCALLNQDLSADTTEFKSRSAAAENVTAIMIYDDYRKLSSDSVVHVCFALYVLEWVYSSNADVIQFNSSFATAVVNNTVALTYINSLLELEIM